VGGYCSIPFGRTGARALSVGPVRSTSTWTSPTGKTLRLELGDITLIHCDAIVNAANSRLAGGGGVDGAIHRAAGPSVMAELDGIRKQCGECPPGGAVVTRAGKLHAQYIIHAVGPVYRGGRQGEADLLRLCYRNAFRLAADRSLQCIAFPAISTGIYGYPLKEAASIAVREAKDFLSKPSSIQEAIFVLFSQAALDEYSHHL